MISFILAHLLALLVAAFLIFAGLALLKFIYRPPTLAGRTVSFALPADVDCALLRKLGSTTQHAAHLSGIHILDDGAEAFAARRSIIAQAEYSIDAQYYMWHADLTGRLLMSELLAAADRGVRVRLLLDDNTTVGTDAMLLAAASHPLIEVRLFNPFILRKPRLPAYIFDFKRLNRRMHNKSLTVDGVASVVGGRNIGDEYFNAHAEMEFADMDVLTVGPVVARVAKSFDAYWNSKSAYPVETVITQLQGYDLAGFEAEVAALAVSEAALAYSKHISVSPLISDEGKVSFDWVPVEFFADDPAKGVGDIPRRKLLFTSLAQKLGSVQSSIEVATAYFVPGRRGAQYLRVAAKSGRKVRVLTNSLASNDVVAVHAGYARYRKQLLRRSVALHELRAIRETVLPPKRGKTKLPPFGASSSSLHAKVFVLDRARVFIGSFNFDPRSLYLNCEMGLMIESARLGARIGQQMDVLARDHAYTPFIANGNLLRWRDTDGKVYNNEPGCGLRQRAFAWIMSWLPMEWLL